MKNMEHDQNMLELFVHETASMLTQFDEILLESEKEKNFSAENIDNIFRITHTIKGSAAMMNFGGISSLSHAVEDVFFVLRDNPSKLSVVFDSIFDLILDASDVLKIEMDKIQSDDEYVEVDQSELIQKLKDHAKLLKVDGEVVLAPKTEAPEAKSEVVAKYQDVDPAHAVYVVHFDDGVQMENMRAFMLMTQLKEVCDFIDSVPQSPETDSASSAIIVEKGLKLILKPTISVEEIDEVLGAFLNLKSYELVKKPEAAKPIQDKPQVVEDKKPEAVAAAPKATPTSPTKTLGVTNSFISVSQGKLDTLMDLVGELVTAESMVERNPDLEGIKLDSFTKAMRELRKLTDELQDVVMSIRMVPLSGTFKKMERIVRDMSKKLDKKAELVMEGGDTEVDKTIIDSIVDPFMHMIRNSLDHGLESAEDRIAAGKNEVGKITMAAKNVGGEIHIVIADDGKGLDPQKLIAKAKKNGLITGPESEISDKDALGLIMLPGFSTNEQVTEFSGRGVGMDVVRQNIEQVGGRISIESVKGEGTTFTIKIPLTLAIVDGMIITVGGITFTIPITAITQFFKVQDSGQITKNSDGSEMIIIRGECYPVIRLHELFDVEPETKDFLEGIFIQVKGSGINACIFADQLMGEYQIVVKPFPTFLNKYDLKNKGLSGCSILGDGNISLIIDVNSLIN